MMLVLLDTGIRVMDMPEEHRKSMFNAIAKQLPVGRVAQPEDISETYIYLAKNGFTTGSVILIDGGALLS